MVENGKIEIRGIKEERIREMLNLQEKEKFSDGWNENQFKGSFKNGNFLCYGAYDEKELVGFVSSSLTEDFADIEDMLVDSRYRRRGIASALLEKITKEVKESGIKKILLEVRETNDKAIKTYEKNGFSQISIRKRYYNGEENAIIMAKELV